MKIESVEIFKFRSIRHAIIHMHDITAIVGENNAGKTAILRALNAVMNFDLEQDSFYKNRHQFSPKTSSKIIVVFCDVPNQFNDKLFNDKLTIEFSYRYGLHKESFTIVKGRDLRERVDITFMKKLSKSIQYVYIPSDRTNKDVSWGEQSIFEQLVTSYVGQYTENRDTISAPVRLATNRIHESALKKLEKTINSLYLQNKDMDFKIDFPQDIDYSVLLEKVAFSLTEYGRSLPLQEFGSGTRSLAVIAMHRANALLQNSSIVLGIEEPEVNLHPQAQKRFILSLRDNRHKNETQSIFTTHSTVLIDSLNHEDIVLVRRISDNRGFVSETHQIDNDFWNRHGIQEFKHYQFFNYRNSDFFFSKYVVVGESKIDCQIMAYLVDPLIGSNAADVCYLDSGGTESLIYPFFLLTDLGIPFTIMVDKDYLFDYKNGDIDSSRDKKSGLPRYSTHLKSNLVLDYLFPTSSSRQKIEAANAKGYRELFSAIKFKNLVCMNYNLESDLTCSSQARKKYYLRERLRLEDQCQKTLLVNCKRSIKNADTIIPIVKSLSPNELPESYKKIKNHIAEQIKEILK